MRHIIIFQKQSVAAIDWTDTVERQRKVIGTKLFSVARILDAVGNRGRRQAAPRPNFDNRSGQPARETIEKLSFSRVNKTLSITHNFLPHGSA
jgi:hypothetical protein